MKSLSLRKSLAFKHFRFFYKHTGIAMLWVFLLSLITGVLDAMGLSFIFPLLQVLDGTENMDSEALGKLSVMLDEFKSLEVPINTKTILIFLVLIFTTKSLFVFLSFYQKAKVRRKLATSIRHLLIEGLSNFSYKKFVEMNIGQMNASFTTEVGLTNSAFERYLGAIYQFILVLTYLVMAILVNAKVTVAVLFIVPPIAIIFSFLNKKTKALSFKAKDQTREFVQSLLQSIVFFKFLKATNIFSLHNSKLKNEINIIEYLLYRIAIIRGWVNTTKELFVFLLVISLIFLQVYVFKESVSSILIVLVLLYRNFSVLMQFQNSWQSFLAANGSLEGVQETIKLINEGAEKFAGQPFDGRIDLIECKNLSFNYGETKIIDNLNLKVKQNQSIAFVGESGSGKTTAANLISGLLVANSGDILINGTSISQYDIDSFRKHIGYITQEPVVFAESIYENITLSKSKDVDTVENFWRACKQAHIAAYIKTLPSKEDTQVGDFGVTLSGGQRQRISIARELFRTPQLLVMDEATSALDSESEETIQENINELKGKTTLILIAHRLSTIKGVDCIYLINEGKVVASGSFAELLDKSEQFRTMVSKQGIET